MPKIKKIYKYKNQLVEICKWCNGTGGRWERVKVLVGEEVIT